MWENMGWRVRETISAEGAGGWPESGHSAVGMADRVEMPYATQRSHDTGAQQQLTGTSFHT